MKKRKYLIQNLNGRYSYVSSLKMGAEYVAENLATGDASGSPRQYLARAREYGWYVYPGHYAPNDANKLTVDLMDRA